jgi:UDP-N-acetylmuramate-alanine ligase
MNASIFIENIKHDNKLDWENFEKTLELINNFDKKNTNSIILLMWAGDIDNLRQKIKTN